MPRCWNTLTAEAAEARDAVREVDFLRAAGTSRAVPALKSDVGHGLGVGPLEPLLFGADGQRAADPHHRIAADLQVQVGRTAGDGGLEEIVDVHDGSAAASGSATGSARDLAACCGWRNAPARRLRRGCSGSPGYT